MARNQNQGKVRDLRPRGLVRPQDQFFFARVRRYGGPDRAIFQGAAKRLHRHRIAGQRLCCGLEIAPRSGGRRVAPKGDQGLRRRCVLGADQGEPLQQAVRRRGKTRPIAQ